MRRIKIAYLTITDPLDKRSWSGITYYLGQSLQRNVGDVDFLGPIEFPWLIDKMLRAISKFTRVVFKKEYQPKHSLLLSWYSAKALKKKMKGKQYDCIVTPAASTEFALLKTDIPSIYVSDATFSLMSNYYVKEYKDTCSLSLWEGNLLEKKSLQKATFVIHCSNWARQSAISDYKIPAEKIHIITLGANMDFVPSRDVIFEKEKNTTLTLLFLAVDWDRKGGSIAFDTLKHLVGMGIEAKLIVCGCVPPKEFSDSHMEVIPFLNKNIKEDHEKFIHLLSSSHFLILPTRADCSLLVACESNAYGMPAIATATGGVPDVVKDDINGYCLPYEAGGDKYAQLIAEVFNDKKKYHEMILSSRLRFEEQLNWEKWADSFKELYQLHIYKETAQKQTPVKEKSE